jgi:hypothetical protein
MDKEYLIYILKVTILSFYMLTYPWLVMDLMIIKEQGDYQ